MSISRFAALALLLLGACSANEVRESSWKPSPTGDWLTRTVRSETSGPGNNYLAETVQVRRVGAKKPVDVLTLEEMSGPATIKLRWRDPTHLDVAYTDGNVIFEAVRVGDLRIDSVPMTNRAE